MEIQEFTQNGAKFLVTEKPQQIGMPSAQVVYIVTTAPNADPAVFPYNKAVLITADNQAKLDTVGDGAGFLPLSVEKVLEVANCYLYVVRVEKDIDPAVTIQKVVGGVDSGTGERTGLEALTAVKTKPTVIAATGYSHNAGVHNKLKAIADKLGCMFVSNLPSGTVQSVTAAADALATADNGIVVVGNVDYTSSKGFITMPGDLIGLALYASIERYQNTGHRGVLIESVDHQYEYIFDEAATEGNLLNKHGVCYFASTASGGYSLIGNRTHGGKFISDAGLLREIRRKISASMELGQGRRLTPTFIKQKLNVINQWLQSLTLDEIAAPGTRCYLHPAKNTVGAVGAGRWYIVVEFDGYPVNENPVIELYENDGLATAVIQGL